MNPRGRNILDDPRTKALQSFAYEGFTHRTIRRYTGLTKGAVEYRLRRLGVSTAGVRRGEHDEARTRILKLVVKHKLTGYWADRLLKAKDKHHELDHKPRKDAAGKVRKLERGQSVGRPGQVPSAAVRAESRLVAQALRRAS